jgi:hypothetical protein
VLATFDGVCPFFHGVRSYWKSIAAVRDRFFPQPRHHGGALILCIASIQVFSVSSFLYPQT